MSKTLALFALAVPLAACSPREEPLRLKQRSETSLAPDVVLKVGDVEMDGDVFLSVLEKGAPVAQKELRKGGVFPFQAGGAAWEVEVARLEPHVLNEDYVHLFVRRK